MQCEVRRSMFHVCQCQGVSHLQSLSLQSEPPHSTSETWSLPCCHNLKQHHMCTRLISGTICLIMLQIFKYYSVMFIVETNTLIECWHKLWIKQMWLTSVASVGVWIITLDLFRVLEVCSGTVCEQESGVYMGEEGRRQNPKRSIHSWLFSKYFGRKELDIISCSWSRM